MKPCSDAPTVDSKPNGWSPERAVVALIVIGTVCRLLIAMIVGFGNGESYYFSCSRYADLSYFDHPPMHAWLARLSTELAGADPLALRAPFVAFFAMTTWLLFTLGRRLFGGWAGFFAALLLNLSPVFSLTTATFLQPDGPLMFFWLLTFAGLARLLLDSPPRHATLWWLGVGLALGITLLCKYHALFIVMGIVVFVVSRKDQRHWLWHPGPYLALALAGAIFSPVLIWNVQHNWISFVWQGERGTSYQGLRWDWLVRSLGGQALWLLPWIWFPLVRELVVGFRRGPSDARRWLVTCVAAPPILFFTITALYAPYGFHFHWQAPGYLLLFLPLGDTVARVCSERAAAIRMHRRLRVVAVASIAAFLFISTQTAFGWLAEVLPAEYGNRVAIDDPTLEAVDYTTLEGALTERGLFDRKNTFLFTSKWYLSGKVDYSLRGRMDVLCFSPDDPRAFAFFEAQERYLGMDGILVSHDQYSEGVEQYYSKYFAKMTYIGTVDVPRGSRTAAKLKLFLGENFRATVPQPYGNNRESRSTPAVAHARPGSGN